MADKKHSILIIDDENTNIDALSGILRSDYKLFATKSGEAALDRARTEKPDLILLDVLMPDMDGFEVLARIKASEETMKIPVVFITGLTGVEDEEKGLSMGAVDYITKPFKAAIVKARVKTQIMVVEQMRMIEDLSGRDALTGLANRRRFDERFALEWKKALREQKPVSVVMIDIDHFKRLNDEHGHAQGDAALRDMASLISHEIKRSTDLATRWGGEEFVGILTDTSLGDAVALGEAIRAKVESTLIKNVSGGADLSVTVSIGAACVVPSACNSTEELLSEADKRLYEAKQSGRNRVCPRTV